MKGLGQKLRDRARELGLADATIAERLGLSQQRYFNYVSDQTEPDYDTLLRICRALNTEPNVVFGFDVTPAHTDEVTMLHGRIAAATATMALPILRLTAEVVDTLARQYEPATVGRPPKKPR